MPDLLKVGAHPPDQLAGLVDFGGAEALKAEVDVLVLFLDHPIVEGQGLRARVEPEGPAVGSVPFLAEIAGVAQFLRRLGSGRFVHFQQRGQLDLVDPRIFADPGQEDELPFLQIKGFE